MEFVRKLDIFLKNRKEYWPIVVVLPTICGGFWQLAELFILDPAFVRFFSVTQMIPDGLLILFILLQLALGVYIPLKILGGREIFKIENNRNKKINGWDLLSAAFLIFFSLYSSYHLWKFLDYPVKITDVKINHIFILTFTIVLCFPLFLIGSRAFIMEIMLLLPDKGKKLTSSVTKFFLKEVENKIQPTKELFYFSFIFFISFIFIAFALIITFRNQIINTKHIINFDNFVQQISAGNSAHSKAELLYFNDKYIFLRTKTVEKENSSIHLSPIIIYKMDDVLFTKD